VNSNTLVFATSYSGNTEETLAAYDQAKALGCQIVIVTSGGKLADLGAADGYPVIRIPAGQPPRTAMGFLMMPVLEAAVRMGLLPSQNYQALNSCLEEAVKLWAIEVQGDKNPAKVMAKAMFNKPVVVYGLGSWQGAAASRWKGQICENAKAMCFAHTYPELCHNELLGWVNADKQSPNGWALVTLRSGDEIPKMAARGAIVPELIQEQATNIFADCIGDTLLEKMLTLTLLGDFVSLYLAAMYEVDPENIDYINVLKAKLADVPF
jgi:glucose/mannose-6-phosphate isomerase